MKTTIYDIQEFKKALAVAHELGEKPCKSFIDCLKQLNRLRRSYEADLYIGPDFVKYSFSFSFTRDGQRILNGGMILHGLQETWAVELDPENYPHWSLHT